MIKDIQIHIMATYDDDSNMFDQTFDTIEEAMDCLQSLEEQASDDVKSPD